MQITSIQQAKKNLDHVNIFLDNEFWINISKDELIGFKLSKDQQLTEDLKAKVEASSQQTKIMEKVYNYQMLRPHSIGEIRTYLTMRRKLDRETADSIIGILINRGELSDEQFAKWYITNRLSNRQHGPNKIKAELLKKGVNLKVIESELKLQSNEVSTDDEKLLAYIAKLKRQIKAKDKYEFSRKLTQRLMSRGYDYSTIKKLLQLDSTAEPES